MARSLVALKNVIPDKCTLQDIMSAFGNTKGILYFILEM